MRNPGTTHNVRKRQMHCNDGFAYGRIATVNTCSAPAPLAGEPWVAGNARGAACRKAPELRLVSVLPGRHVARARMQQHMPG